MASPAFAAMECITPPGSSSGTARWSSPGKTIKEYLTTSSGDRYACGPDVMQNNPSGRVGSKRYFKQSCGPAVAPIQQAPMAMAKPWDLEGVDTTGGSLTIVKEVSYRNCTFEESAGISSGFGFSARLNGSMSKLICAINSNVISDTRYELRDRNGQAFQLGTEYGISQGNTEIGDRCTSNVKIQASTKCLSVESTSKKICLTSVTEYQAEGIKQPSL